MPAFPSQVGHRKPATAPGHPDGLTGRSKAGQALCLTVEVPAEPVEGIGWREPDEDRFRAAEELGIDLSRPERGTDEEDERRREGAR